MLDSDCGDDGGDTTIEAALNGTNAWVHTTNETHWFIIDLGSTKQVDKVRGRSGGDLSYDPVYVNIYVSDNKLAFGTPVISAIDNWNDTTVWQEWNVTTVKSGRYVKVEITSTEEVNHNLEFGGPATGFFKIFDVYVSVAS